MDINYARRLFPDDIVLVPGKIHTLLLGVFNMLLLVLVISFCQMHFFYYVIPFVVMVIFIVIYFRSFHYELLKDVTLKVMKYEGYWNVKKGPVVLPLPKFYLKKEGKPRIEFNKGRIDEIIPILYVDD